MKKKNVKLESGEKSITVGELRKLIENLPDTAQVVSFDKYIDSSWALDLYTYDKDNQILALGMIGSEGGE